MISGTFKVEAQEIKQKRAKPTSIDKEIEETQWKFFFKNAKYLLYISTFPKNKLIMTKYASDLFRLSMFEDLSWLGQLMLMNQTQISKQLHHKDLENYAFTKVLIDVHYAFLRNYSYKALLTFVDDPVVSIWNSSISALKKSLQIQIYS